VTPGTAVWWLRWDVLSARLLLAVTQAEARGRLVAGPGRRRPPSSARPSVAA
jgi:hypothetical protein